MSDSGSNMKYVKKKGILIIYVDLIIIIIIIIIIGIYLKKY